MSERVPAIKVLLLPKDTNPHGTIFGGVILSHIDLASAVEARRSGAKRFVTKAMREVEFHEPVFLGDVVNFYTETVRIGRTSITVHVEVEAGIETLKAFEGTLARGAHVLLEIFKAQDRIGALMYKVWYYASLQYDEDQRNNSINARRQQVQILFAKHEQATSWFSPELLA